VKLTLRADAATPRRSRRVKLTARETKSLRHINCVSFAERAGRGSPSERAAHSIGKRNWY